MIKFIVMVAVLSNMVWGAPKPVVDKMIHNGTNTVIKKYPYMVAVSIGKYACGGSIISPTWILTAAHCINENIRVGEHIIRAGSSSRYSGGQVIAARKVYPHELYSYRTDDYDLGLIELSSPITIPEARPIPLADEGDTPSPGQCAIILGWGKTSVYGPPPDVLQMACIFIRNCRDYYDEVITDRMLCAGGYGRSICKGDSGGPLVVNGKLTGVSSLGHRCVWTPQPAVYASVPNMRSWIRNKTGI